MTDKSSINALDQFLVAFNSLNNYEQAVELIKRVIDSPAVYSFNEFVEVPFIQSVNKN
jgi:hypothetical protein